MEKINVENIKSQSGSIAEFINLNPHIGVVKFVFAHPDDELGYSAGLIAQLAAINSTRLPESQLKMDILIATDGANGTKDRAQRKGLVNTRQMESMLGLSVLTGSPLAENIQLTGSPKAEYILDANTRIRFLGHRDSDIDQQTLEEELVAEFHNNGADLVVTHSPKAWDKSPQLENPYLAVQNHRDHALVSEAVSKAIARFEETGSENIPILLRHTWQRSDLNVQFDPDIKRSSFEAHHSQYSQNPDEMNRIIYELNYSENGYQEHYEVVNPDIKRGLNNTLIQRAGEILKKAPLNQANFLVEAFANTGVQNILILNTQFTRLKPWVWMKSYPQFKTMLSMEIDSETFDRKTFERYVREHQVDFVVMPELTDNNVHAIHQTAMFLSAVMHNEQYELPPHKIKGWGKLNKNATGTNLSDFDINIGVW
jgi:LmbE family N-acetylglucosaminyl deacetylase